MSDPQVAIDRDLLAIVERGDMSFDRALLIQLLRTADSKKKETKDHAGIVLVPRD